MDVIHNVNCKNGFRDRILYSIIPENMVHNFSIARWKLKLTKLSNLLLNLTKSIEILKILFISYLMWNNENYGCTYYSVTIIQHSDYSGKRAFFTVNPYIIAFVNHNHRVCTNFFV